MAADMITNPARRPSPATAPGEETAGTAYCPAAADEAHAACFMKGKLLGCTVPGMVSFCG